MSARLCAASSRGEKLTPVSGEGARRARAVDGRANARGGGGGAGRAGARVLDGRANADAAAGEIVNIRRDVRARVDHTLISGERR